MGDDYTRTLPAGRELDEFVALHVMGWTRMGDDLWQDDSGRPRTLAATSFGEFSPSTDLRAAWEVVEVFNNGRLVAFFPEFNVELDRLARIGDFRTALGGLLSRKAKGVAFRICMAALTVVAQEATT